MIGPKLNSKINLIQDRLTDIREDWSETEGKGFCHCKNCKEEGVAYNGVCNELVSGCNRKNGNYGNNETEKAICDNVNQCATCLSVSIYKYRALHMDWYKSKWRLFIIQMGHPVLQIFEY